MSKFRGISCWPWMLLVLASTSLAEEVEPPLYCCSNREDVTMNDNSHCIDNTSVTLNCTAFKFQPSKEPDETMTIVVINNQTWLQTTDVQKNISSSVQPGRYCLAKMNSTLEVIALICFEDDPKYDQSQSNVGKHPRLFGTANIISSVFLGLTLLTYILLRELREVQDKAIICLVASFMVAYLNLGLQVLGFTLSGRECIIVAYALYYTFMSAFFWMNIISLNIWRHVWFPKLKIRCDLLWIIYYTIGWGMPLCLLVVAVMADHTDHINLKPEFGKDNCWFSNSAKVEQWILFNGPIFVLICLNLLYLGMTSYRLWHQCNKLDCCKAKILRIKCQMFLKLAILMGCSWILEVLSFNSDDSSNIVWLIGDLINVFQGVFIFLILVVCRSKVRMLLAQKRPCGIAFPKSWAASTDHEDCEVVGPDELELSDEEPGH